MKRFTTYDLLSSFTNEEIKTINKQSHQYLGEEYIGDDKAIYVTESAYDVASRMKASKKSLRILWDRHLKLFFKTEKNVTYFIFHSPNKLIIFFNQKLGNHKTFI